MLHAAALAAGPSRGADPASVPYEGVMKSGPFILGYDLHKRKLGFKHIGLVNKAAAVGEPEYMGVHRYALLPEGHGKHHVGRLATDARKLYKAVVVSGNLAVVMFAKHKG